MNHPSCQATDILILKDVLKRNQKKIHQLEVEKYEDELNKQKRINIHQSKLASLGELAAGVGHEINNPLQIAMGAAKVLKKCIKDHENCDFDKVEKQLDKIKVAHDRIVNIVMGLRIYSRQDDIREEEFSLNKSIEQTLSLISEIYKKEEIDLIFNLPSEELNIFGVEGELQQIFMNLLTNAKDAVSEKTEKQIIITLEAHEDEVVIEVKDNGIGIPQEIQDKIFDPFFTTKEVGKGTGLGLGFVQNLVEKMKGKIEVFSKENIGTTFRITFPTS